MISCSQDKREDNKSKSCSQGLSEDLSWETIEWNIGYKALSLRAQEADTVDLEEPVGLKA